MRSFAIALCLSLTLSLLAAPAAAEVLNFQGRLTDRDGFPLNGTYDVTFRIYEAETGGTSVWSETHLGVESALERFASDLAASFRPSSIEERVPVSPLRRWLGCHEGAYWREYRQTFHHLDPAGIRQLARDGNRGRETGHEPQGGSRS